jgi:hypothetical protein
LGAEECGGLGAIFFIAFFNSPCYETPKNAIKNPDKAIKKNRASSYFLAPQQMYVTSVLFCFRSAQRPLVRASHSLALCSSSARAFYSSHRQSGEQIQRNPGLRLWLTARPYF